MRDLVRDHRVVLRATAATERSLTEPRRGPIRGSREAQLRSLLVMLGARFASHLAAEDEILFPALAEALPAAVSTLDPLRAEHIELREMRVRLERTLEAPPSSTRDDEIVVQVRDFAELLRIHIRKEETVVLSVAARLLRPHEVAAVWSRMRGSVARSSAGRHAKTSTKGVSR